jgi:tRNA threonylcarbamoyl adenosine modification protein (Sua5/YciO/YrdC/YwlC family)
MLLQIHPDNPNPRQMKLVLECLRDGGLIIYPTDTVYALGCDIYESKAVERVCKIKNIKPEKANFSFVFYDLSHLSDFTRVVDTATYKLMKKALPGPFTFILEANSIIPKIFKSNKKTIGIRIPANNICRGIVNQLDHPIISTSVRNDGDISEYPTDAEEIHEQYENIVDIVIDGGFGNNIPSTVVDCTQGQPIISRQGLGNLEEYL